MGLDLECSTLIVCSREGLSVLTSRCHSLRLIVFFGDFRSRSDS